MSNQEKIALIQTIQAVRSAVEAGGKDGVPAGMIYAALMEHGCSINDYNNLEAMLIRVGAITKRGQRLYVEGAK